MILSPAWQNWRTLSDELVLRERQFRKALHLFRQWDDLADQFKTINGTTLPAPIPGSNAAMALVQEVERWAKSSGIKIVDLRPAQTDLKDDAEASFGIHLSLEGNWPSIIAFLGRVQNSSLELSVKSLHLQQAEESGSVLSALLSIEKI